MDENFIIKKYFKPLSKNLINVDMVVQNISANGKNYKVIQVQMYKDEKIWREMSNAVEIKN